MRFVSELRRRNVLRMAALYAVTAWLIMQVVRVVLDLSKLPDWIGTSVLGLLLVGFPIALVLSWFYQVTPEGISSEKDPGQSDTITQVTDRRLDFIVISLLFAAVILFAYDKWWKGPPPEKSIAVLAFENMSGDPDQEYFSDGISEELLNLLAQIPELRVTSRSSSFSFKGKDVAIPALAEQLNVAYVLEGSMRRDRDRIRITVQLIEASSDYHVWSQTYDRELNDIFTVQEDIAGAITAALKVELALAGGEAARPRIVGTSNTDAYDAYLMGRELIGLRDEESLREAIRQLELSIRLDANFAPAHAQLGIATGLYRAPGRSMDDIRREASAHLDRAQQLEPELAEGYGGRALIAIAIDPEFAVMQARKALALNPSYADAMYWLLLSLTAVGDYEEATTVMGQLHQLDPLSIVGRMYRANWLCQSGRCQEAHDIADEFIAENSPWGYQLHADIALHDQGQIADGLYWALMADDIEGVGFAAFMMIGENGEALRANESGGRWLDLRKGRFEAGLELSQERLRRGPNNRRAIWEAAEWLYDAGRIDEALPLYERLKDFVPVGRPIPTSMYVQRSSNETMMRLALARRKVGDEQGAIAAADIVKRDHDARTAAGAANQARHRTAAMIAAFENDPDRVIAALESALQSGLRNPNFFLDPVFESLWNDRRFVAQQTDLESILAAERDKVLLLICLKNPTPDNWRPMPETCEGVVSDDRLHQ